jgi:DNA-binding XRE family transcriptional regulator
MTRQNWHWDLNIPYTKIKQILAREDDPRFPRLTGTLLARVQDAKKVFELITPHAFCRRYRAIENEIKSDEWTKEKAAFWKATYLRLSREFQERGEKIRKPSEIELDVTDHALVRKVKQCRKAAVMSQKELAQFMGCSQQFISGIETGRERITIDFLKKLARITSQPIDLAIEPSTKS